MANKRLPGHGHVTAQVDSDGVGDVGGNAIHRRVGDGVTWVISEHYVTVERDQNARFRAPPPASRCVRAARALLAGATTTAGVVPAPPEVSALVCWSKNDLVCRCCSTKLLATALDPGGPQRVRAGSSNEPS
jgi:hypothetical protein